MQLTFDTPEIIKPGGVLILSIFTEPNSYVGLLGTDKEALILQSDSDLNARKIFNDLSNLQSKTPTTYLQINTPYPGGTAGLVTLTNANYYLGMNISNNSLYSPINYFKSHFKYTNPLRKRMTRFQNIPLDVITSKRLHSSIM